MASLSTKLRTPSSTPTASSSVSAYRNHRIGQTRRPVYITLGCSNSIDTRISAALAAKGDVLAEFQDMINQYRAQGIKARAEQLVRAL